MQFLLLVCLVISTHSAYISKGDIWVDYANAGYMTTLALSFMLQTPLTSTDYIKISLPFPLHSSLIPAYPGTEGLSSPHDLQITYQYINNFSNIIEPVYRCQILTEAIDTSIYFIRFYSNDNKTLIEIPNFQWFYFKFTIPAFSDALQFQISNTILQIQIQTVTSVWPNAMIYDDNLAFNFFLLQPPPLPTINLALTPNTYTNNGENFLIWAQYGIFLDVTLNYSSFQYQLQQKLRLVFTISEVNTFLFTSNNCISVTKQNPPIINALNPSLYNCTIDKNKNIMTVILSPLALTLQNIFRFTVNISNPSTPTTNITMQVRAMKQYSSVILAYGKGSPSLNTNKIFMTYQEIFVGWGLRPDNLLPFNARIFRGNNLTPTYKPYNSISTKFSISRSTSPQTQLRLQISIPSQPNAYVLTNAFTHNLPSFPQKQVKCVVEHASDPFNRKIVCTGIGSLDSSVVYLVGWKMFFPFDIFESDINCSLFGVISIYSVKMIEKTDNVYRLGRGEDFLNYMKSSSQYYVIGRNISYLSYVLSFPNIVLVARSTDFQQFLQTPQKVVVTNRPFGFINKIYEDVYVVSRNMEFINYLKNFDDVYVGYQLNKQSDIAKEYNQQPLLTASIPKNTLIIKTCNSKDWTGGSSNPQVMISSDTLVDSLTPTQGLKVSDINQSLIISIQAPFTDVTSVLPNTTTITNNWGMFIMMNSKITPNDQQITLTQLNSSFNASVLSVSSPTAYNNYTLITLKSSTPSAISASFPITPTKTVFSLYPFIINEFSSIFSDQNNFDVMIATVDGIDGPLNKMKFNSYFLINAFTLMNSNSLNTFNSGFVSNCASELMDGSKVPTILRVTGTVANVTNISKIIVFFDQLQPYFQNQYTGQLYCQTSENVENACKFIRGAQEQMLTYDLISYLAFSRIQTQLANPANQFDILIPIKIIPGKLQTYFYLSYTTVDPETGLQKLSYISLIKSITNSIIPYAVTDNYGPDLSGAVLGEQLSPFNIKASSSTTVNINKNNNVGGAFLYFSEWDYFNNGNVTISGWSNGPCYTLYYLLYSTNYAQFISGIQSSFTYTYKNMGGIVCFTDTNNSILSSVITINPSSPSLPSRWGLNLPGCGGYSQDDGNLLTLNTNYMLIPSPIQLTNTSVIITPTMGPNLSQYLGVWTIPLPTNIQDDIMIAITTNNGVNLPFYSPSGVCKIYISSFKAPIICNYVFNITKIIYILTINETTLLPKDTNLSIYHYGLSTNSSYNSIKISLNCFTLYKSNTPTANQLIFFTNNLRFPYGMDDERYIGSSDILLGSYQQNINNKGAITSFYFSFSIISKGLYATERIRINLGQYFIDNNVTHIDAKCKIYQFGGNFQQSQYSHDWAAVDSSQGFNNLQFWPKTEILNDNITNIIKCFNFIATSASIPEGISAKVVNTSADLVGDISSLSSLAIVPLPDLPLNISIYANKKYNIPSAVMELSFVIVSPGITTESTMYVGFPAFYSSGLGSAISCYSTYEIFCQPKNRRLSIRFIGNFDKGVTFAITVTGIQMPINMGIGTFWFVIDNDSNPNTVLSSGTFLDNANTSIINNLVTIIPVIQILSLNLSSYYLRDNCILTLDFYLPSTLTTSINIGQFVLLTFPTNYKDILKFTTPKCTLNIRNNTSKNFISSCSVYGMNIKMPILITMPLGSVYTLTITGLINPSNPSPSTYKYALSITTANNSIMIRSFSPHCNFNWLVFLMNPISISLNYYTASHGFITQLTTYVNIQSQPVYISPSEFYNTSQYYRNVYLLPYSNIYTNPSPLQLLSGMNPFPIRFSSLKSGVYSIYFSKTGDGNYYSNLPPLTFIVNTNTVKALKFVQKQLLLPVAEIGARYKIGLNLPSELYPMTQVALIASFPNNFQGLSLINTQTTMQLSSSQTIAFITLQISDVTQWFVGASVNLTITPINNNTYFGGARVKLTTISYISTAPNAIVFLNVSSYKIAIFNITCSQYGYFVYHVSRQYNYNLTACSLTKQQLQYWLQQSSLDPLRSRQLYYKCQDVIGLINILTPNQSQVLTINELSASTSYTIQGYCSSNLANSQSGLETLSFPTTLNGGFVSKIDIYFIRKLTVQESIKTVCALALLIGVQYQMVSTVDGYFCSDLLSGRLLHEKAINHKQLKQKQAIQNQFYNRLLLTSSFRISIYFGINTKLVNDSTQSIIHSLSVSQTQIIDQLSSVVGLAKVVNMTPSNATYIGSNDIVNETVFVDVGPTYVYVQGMKIQNDGIIYIIIGEDNLWKTDPVISQIKKGSGPHGLPPRFFKALGYRTSEPNSSNAAFIGIGSSRLRMYIVVSDDNPFDTAIFGEIRKYIIDPEKPSYWINLSISVLFTIVFLSLF